LKVISHIRAAPVPRVGPKSAESTERHRTKKRQKGKEKGFNKHEQTNGERNKEDGYPRREVRSSSA
jgi:hypothetical protein